MEKVNVFAKLKKIKKYVYDPEANLFKPELDEQGKEKDGYDLYPDHDHYKYNANYGGKPTDDYTRIQNNPLTKFLILGDFDKKFKAESVMENWHGMSYKSKISSDAQFLCSDENVNLIISEGLRFLEIGWKYRNDNNNKLLNRCDDPEKDYDIYIDLSNIVSLLIYTSEIRRLPYKDGEPIKKYGSPETKVKLTEENAIKLMNEVDRQIKNVSGLLGKDFDLSDYNELCQKISETESEFKKCQNEWFNLLRRSDVKVEYAKYQDNGKKKDILYELTDIDKLKAKYRVEHDVPFIKSDKTIEENYCVWNRISKGRQQEFTKIDERQKPLKNKLNVLKTQQQNVLNRISASSDKYHTEEKKRIEHLANLMNIKSDIQKMIYSQISGNTKLDENNPIEVIKNVVPQIDSTKENIDVPQTENQIKINEEESEKINIEKDEDTQDQNISNSEIIQKAKKDLIQNDNNEAIEQNENADEIQIKLNEEKEDENPEEVDNEEYKNSQDKNISNSEIIQQDNNTLNENQEEDSIQNDNNEDIEQNENAGEIQIKLNEEKEDKNSEEIDSKENEDTQDQNISNSQIIQQDNSVLNTSQKDDLIQNDNNEDIEHSENTEEILNGDKNETQNKTNSEKEVNEEEELEDPSKKLAEQKISSETKQEDNSNMRTELSTMGKDFQSSMLDKRQADQQKRRERAGEFRRLQHTDVKLIRKMKTLDNNITSDTDEQHIEPEQKMDENDQVDNKGENGNDIKSNIAQTDSKNSTDNAIVRFFKWLINKIRSWFGYPELWPLNNVKIPDEINSTSSKKDQQLQNKNPKLEGLSRDFNKQDQDI